MASRAVVPWALLVRNTIPLLFWGISNLQMLDFLPPLHSRRKARYLGNLFNGKEWSGRLDYNFNPANRLSVNYNWFRSTDADGPLKPQGARGFKNPERNLFPTGQMSWVHTFSPTVLNEFRAGYTLFDQSAGRRSTPACLRLVSMTASNRVRKLCWLPAVLQRKHLSVRRHGFVNPREP